MKKEFRVSHKTRNEFIFLINTLNTDEFYLISEKSLLPDKKTYLSDEIRIDGRFAEIIKNQPSHK